MPRASALDVAAEALVASGTGREEAATRAAALLGRLNLPAALFDLPPATFSGGEKQRVNIARGFSTDHPVLLLDEPTAHVDPDSAATIGEVIARLAETRTVIAVTHQPDLVGRADQHVHLTPTTAPPGAGMRAPEVAR